MPPEIYCSKNTISKAVLLLLCIHLVTGQLDIASISITDATLSAQATYTFNIFRYSVSSIPVGSSLTLNFNSAYSARLPSTPTCAWSSPGNFNSTSVTCSYLGTVLTLNNLFSNSTHQNLLNFIFTVSSVTNPAAANTYTPVATLQIHDAASTLVDSGTNTQTVTITPLAATCTSVITSGGVVFGTGVMAVTYTSSVISGTANSSYNIAVNIPFYYPSDSTQTTISPTFSQFFTVTPLSASNIYSFSFVSSFTLSLLMPPSDQAIPNFITISTENANGTIDTCSIGINSVAPNVFNTLTVSSATVQTTANLNFNLVIPMPLYQTDQLQLVFGSAFSLGNMPTTGSVAVSGTGNFNMTRIGNLVKLTPNIPQPIPNATLPFTLPNVTLPFSSAPQSILISLLTFDNYHRVNQSYSYVATPGTITASVTCLNSQIGISTSCLFSLATSSSLLSGSIVELVLDSTFPLLLGSSTCTITSSSSVISSTSCIFISSNSTIQVTNFNTSSANFPPMNLTVNVTISMSQSVGAHTIGVRTLSKWSVVDSGSTTITAVARQLTSSQIGLASSSLTTYSSTTYTVSIGLPFDLGSTYTIDIHLPVDLQPTLTSPLITNATLLSYNSTTKIISLSASNLTSATIAIAHLLTPPSTVPTTLSLNVSSLGTRFFYGSTTIAMTALRTPTSLTLSQSNVVVYKLFTATITLSDLAVGDTIKLTSTAGSYFYSSSQNGCSVTVASCNAGGVLKVASVNNGGGALTNLQVDLVNLAHVGAYTLTVTVFDASEVYGKQNGTVLVSASTPNAIAVSSNQTNPYMLEQSTYSFLLNFTTPNATTLLLTPSSAFANLSARCSLNCGTPTTLSTGFAFGLTSTYAVVEVTATNPAAFNAANKFTFLTEGLSGQKDYGQFSPLSVCALPCRSCVSLGGSVCLSCYSWHSSPYLLNNTCVSVCPSGYFVSISNALSSCLPCALNCSVCLGLSSNCSSCLSGFVLSGTQCVSTCPAATYVSANSTCLSCNPECSSCLGSAGNCTSCLTTYNSLPYYLFANQCIPNNCPSSYYAPRTNNTCQPCPIQCATCTATQCLTCNSPYLYYAGQCLSSCPGSAFPGNSTHCLTCPNSCSGCTSFTVCTACVSGYLMDSSTTSCVASCPLTFYSNGVNCLSCPSTPAPCATCSLTNQIPTCYTCQGTALIQEYLCVNTCTFGNASGQYCSSTNCSQLSNCLVCSGMRCIQCSSLYTLDSTLNCQQNSISNLTSQAIATFSQIPVPFPFLIAIFMVIIISFFLRHHYPKMFSPLFVYALAGVLEQLCLVLWTVLTIIWRNGLILPLPLISVAYAPALILIVYVTFNVVQFICWKCKIQPDKKYALWEIQDNKCASYFIAFLGIFLSFRLDAIKFSRTGHSQRLSARLSSPSKFKHYSVLAIFGIFLNATCILASVYLSYLQGSLNYLFFNCLEVTILSVVMIVLSIVMLCVPRQQLLEDKKQYSYGYDQDQLEGPSLQEVLQVEEHNSNAEMSEGGKLVMRKGYSQEQDSSQQDVDMLTKPEKLLMEDEDGFQTPQEITFEEEEGAETIPTRRGKGRNNIFAVSGGISQSEPLEDQLAKNMELALAMTEQYLPKELNQDGSANRQIGSISKQKLKALPEEPSEDLSSYGDYEEYTLNLNDKEWTKKRKGQDRVVGALRAQQNQADEQIQALRMILEQQIIEEKKQQEELRGKLAEQRRLDEILQKQRIQQQKRKEPILRQKQVKQQRILKQKLAEEQSKRQTREQIQKICKLKQALLEMEQQKGKLQAMQQQVSQNEKELQIKEQERKRQQMERRRMLIEDKLSNMARLFQNMKDITKKKISKRRKIQSDQTQEQKISKKKEFVYSNNDTNNLQNEVSPRKIKIRAKPTSEQYKSKHVYVEENDQIFSDSDMEDVDDGQLQFFVKGNENLKMRDNKEMQKPKSLQRQKTAKKPKQHYTNQLQSYQNFRNPNPPRSTPEQAVQTALAPMQYEQYNKQFRDESQPEQIEEDLPKGEPQQLGEGVFSSSKNIVIQEEQVDPNQQITVYDDQYIDVEESEHTVRSQSENAWHPEPQIRQRIQALGRRADSYLNQPKTSKSKQIKNYVEENPSQIYEQEDEDQSDRKTIQQIRYQQKQEKQPRLHLDRSKTRKRFVKERVNRRIINLDPHK